MTMTGKHYIFEQKTLKQTLMTILPFYRKALFFGFFTNLMLLAPSWYMLEVYDRVINSRNTKTLVMLTLLITFIYLVMEALEWVRKKMLYSAAAKVEHALQERLFEAAFAAKLKNPQFASQQVFTDFSTIKTGLYSSAILALVDLPFTAIFLLVIYLIHPALGLLATLSLLIQLAITLSNQYRVEPQMQEANKNAIEAQRYFTSVSQKTEAVQAMGMLPAIEQRWQTVQQAFLYHQAQASELAAKSAASAKFLQTLQSSLILGLACYLVIQGDIAHGGAMMIIASILAARVLAPLVLLVGQWKQLNQAKEAYLRLQNLLQQVNAPVNGMDLPAPTGEITVENVSHALANITSAGNTGPDYANTNHLTKTSANEIFLKNISFQLKAGEVLVIAGPSASGKTTLSRLLAGLVAPTYGKVHFNGVDAYAWDKNDLGQHLGYMSQEVELMDGTVAENIARFGISDEAGTKDQANPHVEEKPGNTEKSASSKLAEVIDLLDLHVLIARLPQGLETQIGTDGAYLSGGQRQLIGLARAAYGAPKIIILDEPNANLDPAGEKSLQHMVTRLKQQGCSFIIISHLQNIVSIADHLMVMMGGQMLRFGKPADVMASLQSPAVKVAQA